MNNEIPTVRIKSDNPFGYAIINESDFDSSEHELFNESQADGEPTDELDDSDSEAVASLLPRGDAKGERASSQENMTATAVTEENPDGTPPEPKSRKRRQSVET